MFRSRAEVVGRGLRLFRPRAEVVGRGPRLFRLRAEGRGPRAEGRGPRAEDQIEHNARPEELLRLWTLAHRRRFFGLACWGWADALRATSRLSCLRPQPRREFKGPRQQGHQLIMMLRALGCDDGIRSYPLGGRVLVSLFCLPFFKNGPHTFECLLKFRYPAL